MQILRADLDARTLGRLHRGRQVREWRTNHDLAMLRVPGQRPELLKKRAGFGGRLVHLPIARHDWLSHTIWGKKLVPF